MENLAVSGSFWNRHILVKGRLGRRGQKTDPAQRGRQQLVPSAVFFAGCLCDFRMAERVGPCVLYGDKLPGIVVILYGGPLSRFFHFPR